VIGLPCKLPLQFTYAEFSRRHLVSDRRGTMPATFLRNLNPDTFIYERSPGKLTQNNGCFIVVPAIVFNTIKKIRLEWRLAV
jgi:hypothetical protein